MAKLTNIFDSVIDDSTLTASKKTLRNIQKYFKWIEVKFWISKSCVPKIWYSRACNSIVDKYF